MRPILTAAVLLAPVLLLAAPAAAINLGKPAMDHTVQVPEDHGPQRVQVLTRDIPAGGAIGWHTHAGTEIAYVESGAMELRTAGLENRTLRAGESFVMPRDTAHSGRNTSDAPVRLVITYILDREAPQREAAPEPQGE